jgi:hypothetical protein
MPHTLIYRGWILCRNVAPSAQQIQSIRMGLDLKGVYAIQPLPSAGKYSLTLKPLWGQKSCLFPPLLGWNPYVAPSVFPLFSHAILPSNKVTIMTDINKNPYRIQYGDWWVVANFPADWYPAEGEIAVIPMA